MDFVPPERFRRRSTAAVAAVKVASLEVLDGSPDISDETSAICGYDDLSRNVFGVLGIPIDALTLDALLWRIDTAISERKQFLLSTPNVNFLMTSRIDRDFHESLLVSDVCPVDGMPIVWIARLLGAPIPSRLSGSDLFDAIRSRRAFGNKLKVFLFGGEDGIAEQVSETINADERSGMACVGVLNPGFGSIAEMSSETVVDQINASRADFVTVFLSAQKAQAWLLQNHDRLDVPVRAQLGATINLQAGIIKRAPVAVQRTGLEWLWRIKEEPHLWRRYLADGLGLVRLLLACVLPLSVERLMRLLAGTDRRGSLVVERSDRADAVRFKLFGPATARHINAAISAFRQAIAARKAIVIDLSETSDVDARFFGLLLMLRKELLRRGGQLSFVGISPRMRRIFRLNGFGFLLEQQS